MARDETVYVCLDETSKQLTRETRAHLQLTATDPAASSVIGG